MTYQPAIISDNLSTLPQLPGWVTTGHAETLETVAFRSGAALAVFDQLSGDPRHGVPVKLLANRLALSAAMATSCRVALNCEMGNPTKSTAEFCP